MFQHMIKNYAIKELFQFVSQRLYKQKGNAINNTVASKHNHLFISGSKYPYKIVIPEWIYLMEQLCFAPYHISSNVSFTFFSIPL